MVILPSGASLPDNPRIGYDNLITAGSLSSDEADADFPLTNLENDASYPPWKGETAASQNIVAALTGAQTVDYIGLARHNFGTASITYTLEHASSSGGPWTSIVSNSPSDDRPILHQFTETTDSFFRLALSGMTAVPELAVWYLGQILVVERRIYVGHSPITLSPNRRVSTGRSENGQFLGRVRRATTYRARISLQNLDPDWYRNNLDPFVDVVDSQAFFWAWRPESFADEVAYCWADEEPRPANQRSNGMMQWDLSIQGIV